VFHAVIAVRSEAIQEPDPPCKLPDRRSRHGGLGWWRCAPELPARRTELIRFWWNQKRAL